MAEKYVEASYCGVFLKFPKVYKAGEELTEFTADELNIQAMNRAKGIGVARINKKEADEERSLTKKEKVDIMKETFATYKHEDRRSKKPLTAGVLIEDFENNEG